MSEQDDKPDSSSSKRSLKTATNQLKAEALRRLKLDDAENEGDNASDAGDSVGSRQESNLASGSSNRDEKAVNDGIEKPSEVGMQESSENKEGMKPNSQEDINEADLTRVGEPSSGENDANPNKDENISGDGGEGNKDVKGDDREKGSTESGEITEKDYSHIAEESKGKKQGVDTPQTENVVGQGQMGSNGSQAENDEQRVDGSAKPSTEGGVSVEALPSQNTESSVQQGKPKQGGEQQADKVSEGAGEGGVILESGVSERSIDNSVVEGKTGENKKVENSKSDKPDGDSEEKALGDDTKAVNLDENAKTDSDGKPTGDEKMENNAAQSVSDPKSRTEGSAESENQDGKSATSVTGKEASGTNKDDGTTLKDNDSNIESGRNASGDKSAAIPVDGSNTTEMRDPQAHKTASTSATAASIGESVNDDNNKSASQQVNEDKDATSQSANKDASTDGAETRKDGKEEVTPPLNEQTESDISNEINKGPDSKGGSLEGVGGKDASVDANEKSVPKQETAEEKDNSETTESNVQEEGKSMETSESAAQGTSDKDATKVESETNEVPDEPKQSAETQEKVDSKKGSPKTDEGGVADEAKAAKGEEMGEDQKVTAAGSSEDTAGLEAVETEGGAEQQGDEVQGGEAGDAERVIPDDFYYDYDDMASKPFSTEGIPNQLISFHHSFGFECTKRSNLHVIDEDIALFSAGNMVELLNLKTREQKYLRTTGGGGIGAIAVHPSRKYFAVAEKGIKPDINIFEYPSLKLYRVLRDGTEEAYANLDFSPDGSMLASVGSSPDFMLTVWDWIKEKVLLRSKAFSQDVYKVAFSPDNEGHLCTSGSGHIRFWEMANTFTGLKLQGLIGKFGAKEISDIEGFVELPDGKVLSGSEWGNMLLWDGGLIKVEISKKGKKTCHNGTIEQFFMDEGELVTIGMDGFVKVWDFESIDNADTTEEGSLFEMDPMYELKVGADVKLMSMQKAVNSEAPIWYAQDAAGGIWKLDLSFTHTSHAPERLFSFHAGHITGLDTSPVAHLVATTGEDYTVRVYDYLSKKQMCQSRYSTGGTSLLWVPKSVDSNGTKILAGFNDGVVRLLTLNKVDPSQVRSKKSKSNYKLSLTQVFKPHTKPVTVMTIDKEGELLATGSNDCTVFFFSIGETYKPIGFVETASPVKSIEWSKKGKKGKSLLVSCKDGTVLEVEAPDPGEHDTSKTFHLPLTNLKITEFLFKSVKDKLRKAEEAERKAKEEEEKRKKKEAEQARRRARGLEDEEEEEEEEETKEGEGEEEEQDKQQEERQPSEIIKSFYYGPDKNKFWLSMDGWDAGYLYECDFEEKPSSKDDDTTGEPVKSLPVPNSNDTPIRSVYLTNSGRFLMFGMDDGQIRIHPVEPGKDLESLSNYWSFTIHDNHNGSVWQLRTSFDDKYVFSVGAEGNFFAHQFMDSAVKGLKLPSKVSLPSPKKLIGEDGQEIEKKVDDIDDPNFYSIELEKQKAEHDRMVKLAEEKKQKVRRKIAELRRTFKQLMNRNQDLPGHVQLATEEFIIDPEIRKELESHTQEKIDLVHREMSWESEKHAIGLRKLQKRFKDELECERIVLIAFLTEHQVSSFRKSKPDYLQQLLQDAEGPTSKTAEVGEGVGGKKATSTFRAAQMKRQSTVDKLMGQQKQQQQPGGGQSQLGGKVAKALEKAEARRKKRLARQAQWDDLNRNKPDENYEDPSDKAAIKNAREHMGDYKLKTAKDYVVPESQRVNAAKKRVQLLKLLDQIHYYKLNFNQKFLALRNKKMAVIKEAKEAVKKLEMIQKKLDFHSRRPIPKVPSMRPEECPEKRLEYTRDQLLEFKKEKDEKDKQGGGHDDGGGGGGGFGGFGGFGGGESKLGAGKSRDRSISSVSVHSSGRPKSSLSGVTEKGTPEPTLEEVPEESSPLEQELQYEERIRLSYEQDVLVDHINSMLRKFDADLRTLRHEKMNTEVGLKCADLRQVTLFEEFVLLKDFEKRENVYANKVNTRLEEKEDMQDKVEDCQLKLDTKKQDIEKLQDQEKALHTTFATTLGENNKFDNFLTKVFKKKIKRAKKKTQTEEGSDEDSEDENSDDDFSSSDEEDSDAEELDDSVCPPGCDQGLFDHVCQLRERRLDLEEELAEEKKTSESLKKELDALVKKAKVIDSALKTAEADLEAFQREKQQKLNELDVVVVLRLHQVQHMINGSIPHDLSNCLVFGGAGLINLQSRIKELEKEKHEQKRLYREHRQTHVQLIRDKKVMESRIDELEEKVRNMMMLKFGRLVDLEKLETVTVNRTVEELKEKLRQAESESARDVAKWDSKIDSYKQKSTQLTRENTQRLDTFTVLLQEKKELEHMLDSRQKSLGTEFTGARKADLRERQRLVQLVQLQAQEIDALKDEITLLSRKGGHILPPAQPPLPPGQTPIPNQ